jgi:hypothetical protein
MIQRRILLASGSQLDPSGGASSTDAGIEPGTVDNRLSLDPSDERWSKAVDSWEDGEEYELTLSVKQISPGEYEVISATPAKGSDKAADDTEDEEDDSSPSSSYQSAKPGVQAIMD